MYNIIPSRSYLPAILWFISLLVRAKVYAILLLHLRPYRECDLIA